MQPFVQMDRWIIAKYFVVFHRVCEDSILIDISIYKKYVWCTINMEKGFKTFRL